MKQRILHLDDDPIFRQQVRDILSGGAYELASFHDPKGLWQSLEQGQEPAVVILDIFLDTPGEDGRNLAKQLRVRLPRSMIIMCSDLQDHRTVHACMARGADDFLFKGQDESHLRERIDAASHEYLRRCERALPQVQPELPHIAGQTARDLAERIPRLIQSALSAIHIKGETGTGKEVVADIFAARLDKKQPFIRVHCGTFPAGLIESELFGHVKGAFTGAQQNKVGLFEQANGGWIFLDEVATLSPTAQIALLRVLENQELRPVGATVSKKIVVRVLSATNEDLAQLVEAGTFRRDLWQRLCEAIIELPPLAERKAEIDELAPLFCGTMRGGPYELSAAALQVLKQYDWRHGNIRELRNCLRAMTEHAYGGVMSPSAIPAYIWTRIDDDAKLPRAETQSGKGQILIEWDPAAPIQFEVLSMRLLLGLIRSCFAASGHMTLRQLSKQLDIPRSTLSTRLHSLVRQGLIEGHDLKAMVNIQFEPTRSGANPDV